MRAQFVRGGDPLRTLDIGIGRLNEFFIPVEKEVLDPIFKEYKFNPEEKIVEFNVPDKVKGIRFMGIMKKPKEILCEYLVAVHIFLGDKGEKPLYHMGYYLENKRWITSATDSLDICKNQIKAWIEEGSEGIL